MPQIIRLTSEALQASIRRLLPSQQGFGIDLEATNVVTPIIDLTPTAEGSVLGVNLQTAMAFGSQTTFLAQNNTQTIANTPGFYRVQCIMHRTATNTTGGNARIELSDGLATKVLYQMIGPSITASDTETVVLDFTVFLRTGDTLTAVTNETTTNVIGSARQIADVNGNLVNPAGFTSE